MRKFVLGLTMLLFAISLNAGGKLLFDLTAQHFSKAMAKKDSKDYGKEGRYDLPNAYVTTDNRFYGYGYKDGVFSVGLKTMPKNWRVNITVYNGNYDNNLIKASTSTGSNYVVSIKNHEININNQSFKIERDLAHNYIEVGISSINGVTEVRINGQKFYKTKANPSDKLQIVEVSSIDGDYLSRLEIFSVD